MNPEFLRYYSQELQHVREVAGEFAQDYPKIAGRLGLDSFECADPYVERLLEGFGYLAARVQLKIDAEFPRFTQHLAELVYPHLLAPTPSMMVVQLQPDPGNPALLDGYVVARGTSMRSLPGQGEDTACEYRSAHDLTLWPVELAAARFVPRAGILAAIEQGGETRLPVAAKAAKAGIRLRLRGAGGIALNTVALDRLCLHLRGADDMAGRLYEKIVGGAVGVLVAPAGDTEGRHHLLPAGAVRPMGFDDDQALLPGGPRTLAGYRLLQEYFAFPQRYHFVAIDGLRAALADCPGDEIDITILLDSADTVLERSLDASNFALHCTPAANLFQRRADRIDISGEQYEYHVLADRTRPLDFEVFQIDSVTGYGSGPEATQQFQPFYTAKDGAGAPPEQAFYQIRREARSLSRRQRRDGPRSSYLGSEAFISIVDAAEAPYRGDLRQLGLSLWCTNRDLPLALPLGLGKTDFILDSGAPLAAARCLAGPSLPYPSFAEGSVAWRLLNHLSLNYLSLLDNDPERGAVALREMLSLYCHAGDVNGQRQIEGVRSIGAAAVTRRLPSPGPITFGRGLRITVTLDDAAFEGTGAFLLGGVLSHFFAQYVSINSFTETVVRTLARGEIMRWPAREGVCAIL